jgi:hypothetical protein
MANSLLTPTVIVKEALMEFKNQLGFTKGVNRQYDDQFAQKGAKVGASINIRKPVIFTAVDGATLSNQDVTEESVTLTLDTQKHVAFNFTSKDLTLTVDEFKDRYLKSAVTALANQVDVDGLGVAAKNTFQSVGVAGTTPSALLTYLQAQQKLNEMGAPDDGNRTMIINPAASTSIVDGLKGLFQSSEQISKQYEKGMMGIAAGAKWKMAQNIYTYTSGQRGGTPLTNGVPASGASTLVTDGWTAAAASRVKAGDVFTIAAVYSVNPLTKVSTGILQQFVCTADGSSDGSGNLTLSISPSIVLTGTTQNVSALPADNAALTFLPALSTLTANNILYHKDAYVLGCADLEIPGGVDMSARASDPESGLSVRMVRQYDINNDKFITRLDILYGWKTVRPEFACKILG